MKFLGVFFVTLALVVLVQSEEAPPADVEIIEPKSSSEDAKPIEEDKRTAKRGAYYGIGYGYGYGGYYGGYYPYYSGYYHYYPHYSYGYGYGHPWGSYYYW